MGDVQAEERTGAAAGATAAPQAASTARSGTLNLKAVLTMAFAHFSHDLYGSFIAVLIPPIQDKLGIPLSVVSLMSPAQQFPSILQPAVGAVADRVGRRWFVVLAPSVAAVSVSLVGLAPHFGIVLLLLLTAGLASAAFHPPAVTLAGEFSGGKTGQAMGWFMAGGQLARTLGPLLITAAIAWFTLEGSFVVMIFGLLASVLLFLTLDTREVDTQSKAKVQVPLRPLLRARWSWITSLVLVGFVRSVSSVPFTLFLVKLLEDQGHSAWYGGFSLSVLFGAGVFGGFLGGTLSDQYGRRSILALTSVISPPLLYLYLWQSEHLIPAIALLIVNGVVLSALRPVQLAYIHDMVPEAPGPANGLILAFQFVGQSVAAFAFGAFADSIGLVSAFWWVPPTALLALPLIALLPGRRHIAELHRV
ncbi:MAG TPA: MFS transporter [Nitrolancea sp.]|nr:MFS transporter [Nitrolancea sp.]